MPKPAGFIFYEGPSLLDGSPIVAIATLSTSNAKTGNMVQTWILRSDMTPLDASQQKLDSAICGSCPHRHSVGGACYVNVGQAPQGIYRAYARGRYPSVRDVNVRELLTGRKLRMGAYGDPAAVPYETWRALLQFVDGHTGYTHQIRHRNFDKRMLELCMVSADTPKAAAVAHEQGAKTFRIAVDITDRLPGEIECLSDAVGMSCADCGLCKGSTSPQNIVIQVHGSRSGRFLNNRKAA